MYRTLKPKQKLQNKLITHIRNDVRFNSRLLKLSSKLVLLLSKNKQLIINYKCLFFIFKYYEIHKEDGSIRHVKMPMYTRMDKILKN